jgi:hypothetical protein
VRRLDYCSILLAVLFLSAICAPAATYRSLSLDALVANSEYVVYGRVVASHVAWDSATKAIWTKTEIQVLDGAKGRPGNLIAVTEPGGVINGHGEFYPGTPQFRLNEEVVLFLYRAPGNRLRVVGSMQGIYNVSTDLSLGQRVVASAGQQIKTVYQSGSTSLQTAKSRVAAPQVLNSFLRTIREKAAAK